MLFLGSDDGGRVVTSLMSVAAPLASEESYDVHVVRRSDPPTLEGVESHPDLYDERSTDR